MYLHSSRLPSPPGSVIKYPNLSRDSEKKKIIALARVSANKNFVELNNTSYRDHQSPTTTGGEGNVMKITSEANKRVFKNIPKPRHFHLERVSLSHQRRYHLLNNFFDTCKANYELRRTVVDVIIGLSYSKMRSALVPLNEHLQVLIRHEHVFVFFLNLRPNM